MRSPPVSHQVRNSLKATKGRNGKTVTFLALVVSQLATSISACAGPQGVRALMPHDQPNPQMPPPGLSSMGWGQIGPVSSRRQPPSVLALEPTAEVASSRRNSPSWCVICRIKCSITCCRMTPSCWLVSSATVFAIASMTSSASAVSTLPEPACPIPCGRKSLSMWGWRSELLPGG